MKAVFAVCLFLSIAVEYAPCLTSEPTGSAEWFTRASDLMTLRTPGTMPFHLHVVFTASPGLELPGPNTPSSIISGDGTYDEVWMEPHQWRREVKLGDYHATEVERNGARRFQGSSDYEPARVSMLLESLLSPIPRVLTSKEFHQSSGWAIDHVNSGSIPMVRLSRSRGSQRAEFTDSFFFFPSTSAVAISNYQGLVTIWAGDTTYDNKIVPQEITIKAGDRTLLYAKVAIERVNEATPESFSLDAPTAEPGMTLRPLHSNEVRMPDLSGVFSWMSNELGPAPVFSMIGTLDRHGRFRELEVVLAPNLKSASYIVNHFRNEQAKPAIIDGSPCQVRMSWRVQ